MAKNQSFSLIDLEIAILRVAALALLILFLIKLFKAEFAAW